MGLSSSLLVLAVLCAVVPAIAIGPRPPASIRNLEKGFVTGIATLGIGTFVVSRSHPFGLFTISHLMYLLAVVTVPLLLALWYVLAFIRRRRNLITKLYGITAVVLALLGVWGTHIEPNWLEVDRVAITASVQAPVRIAVLADLQTPNIGKHELNAIDTILAEEPDLVVVPGDLYQGNAAILSANAADFVSLLERLVDNVEMVAVVSGDSDDGPLLGALTKAAGATLVDNSIRDIVVKGQTIRLAGLQVLQAPARLTTIADLAAPSDAFTLLLAHRPDVVYELRLDTDVDLIVAGHTHGGQISLPFIGPPVTFSDVPRSIAAGGLGVVNNFPLYVSTGVGLERKDAPQVRFGVRPSIGIIDLIPSS